MKSKIKQEKGITLIALVVTIIVLLILAGISINALAGQNGLLNRTVESKEATGIAQTEEAIKVAIMDAATQGLGTITDANLKTALNNNVGAGKYEISGDATSGWTVTVNGKEYKIDSTGKIDGTTTGGGETGTLPTGEGTTPYLPNSTFSKKEGDLATGLVIQDANQNEYVWVEVPTTIYDNTTYNNNGANKPNTAADWEKIRDCLKAYTVDYSNSSNKDTNTDGTTYSDDYKNMLKSVYTNGGFWIGRYETGLEGDTPRTSNTGPSDKAVVKQNKIPYNLVTRDVAQKLATRMNYNECTSSLLFGIQWDLTLKYIEEKTVEAVEEANKDKVRTDIKRDLTSDSRKIGNYYNNLWNITNANAKYSIDNGVTFKACPRSKAAVGRSLLTTGADTSFSLMNIYDIAGNVCELTREFSTTDLPCVGRGGYHTCNGSLYPAKSRSDVDNGIADCDIGFRVGLWK